MLGAQIGHQGIGHAEAAVGGRQSAHEFLDGIDEGSQRRSGGQALILAGLDHGGGGHDTAVDHRCRGQGKLLADQRNGHDAAQDGRRHTHHGTQHRAPLIFEGHQIHGGAHVEQQEILAQAGHTGKAGDFHHIGRIDPCHEQGQEADHNDEHGRDLGLREGAHQVAHKEDQQYCEYCLIGCHFHFSSSSLLHTGKSVYLDSQRAA